MLGWLAVRCGKVHPSNARAVAVALCCHPLANGPSAVMETERHSRKFRQSFQMDTEGERKLVSKDFVKTACTRYDVTAMAGNDDDDDGDDDDDDDAADDDDDDDAADDANQHVKTMMMMMMTMMMMMLMMLMTR